MSAVECEYCHKGTKTIVLPDNVLLEKGMAVHYSEPVAPPVYRCSNDLCPTNRPDRDSPNDKQSMRYSQDISA